MGLPPAPTTPVIRGAEKGTQGVLSLSAIRDLIYSPDFTLVEDFGGVVDGSLVNPPEPGRLRIVLDAYVMDAGVAGGPSRAVLRIRRNGEPGATPDLVYTAGEICFLDSINGPTIAGETHAVKVSKPFIILRPGDNLEFEVGTASEVGARYLEVVA